MEFHDHVIDYLKWRGNILISEDGFNEIDAMICAELSYLNVEDIVPGLGEKSTVTLGQIYNIFEERIRNNEPVNTQAHVMRFLKALGPTRRYKDIVVSDYLIKIVDGQQEAMQFGAITIHINPWLHYISFRGTDPEMVGWKENLNMLHMTPVPSQTEAVNYMNQVMKGWFRKYYIGGHSKGGNVAKYASTFCNPKLQKKIKTIYCYDAPGFLEDMLEYPSYVAIKDRIKAYSPQGSIVGMLLKHTEGIEIIKSQGEGIGQHDLETWCMNGDGFVRAEKRDRDSYAAEAMVENWLGSFTREETAHFASVFIDVVTRTGIPTFPELMNLNPKKVFILLKEMKNISAEDKDIVYRVLKRLYQAKNESKKIKMDETN